MDVCLGGEALQVATPADAEAEPRDDAAQTEQASTDEGEQQGTPPMEVNAEEEDEPPPPQVAPPLDAARAAETLDNS